jgi:alanine racemase
VTFFGGVGDKRISLEEVAREANTIAYELSCAVGKRVKRIYIGGEESQLPTQPAGDGSLLQGVQNHEPKPHSTHAPR